MSPQTALLPDGLQVIDVQIANSLLAESHYLGDAAGARLVIGWIIESEIVAAQIWRWPTSRHLPADGTWLELSRWCLTPAAGANAGSKMDKYARHQIRESLPAVTTLISYSDPSVGHTGALYRACNWQWAPTWHRLRPPPTAGGSWDGRTTESVKDRWFYPLAADARRSGILSVKDASAERRMRQP